MSGVFLDYSKYYDLLYQDKDYRGEAEFICGLIRRHCPEAKRILNLGCGTGKHDRHFVEAGFSVTGLDLSQEMIDIARKSNDKIGCDYFLSDARTFSSQEPFDAVISLFHVFSYQATNADALDFLRTVRKALKPGGVGIFDYWYAPAVIHQKPQNREKHVSSDSLHIHRTTRSQINYTKSVVQVEFEIRVVQKDPPEERLLRETHPMRYFTCNEVDLLTQMAGLTARHAAWLSTDRFPGIDDWNAYSIVNPLG
jgi:SAM-dependent methyltransferase